MRILVTGGTGYIGSNTALALAARGHEAVLFDNLYASEATVPERLAAIAGRPFPFYRGDVRRQADLATVLEKESVDAVIHLAGLKAAPESVRQPMAYYDSNLIGTHTLCRAMEACGVRRLIFSSSAAVYGEPTVLPTSETAPRAPVNPYGRTKLAAELLLEDLAASDDRWSIMALRYFNPVGGWPGGLLGENPSRPPDNLMPRLCRVAAGLEPVLKVFGGDYPTPDGTAIRDYIHVMDLAEGHCAAAEAAVGGWSVLNLGTGAGCSVLELVKAFERVNGVRIPLEISARRPGDAARSYADPARAEALLGWRASRGLEAMCRDAWAWQQRLMKQGAKGA